MMIKFYYFFISLFVINFSSTILASESIDEHKSETHPRTLIIGCGRNPEPRLLYTHDNPYGHNHAAAHEFTQDPHPAMGADIQEAFPSKNYTHPKNWYNTIIVENVPLETLDKDELKSFFSAAYECLAPQGKIILSPYRYSILNTDAKIFQFSFFRSKLPVSHCAEFANACKDIGGSLAMTDGLAYESFKILNNAILQPLKFSSSLDVYPLPNGESTIKATIYKGIALNIN